MDFQPKPHTDQYYESCLPSAIAATSPKRPKTPTRPKISLMILALAPAKTRPRMRPSGSASVLAEDEAEWLRQHGDSGFSGFSGSNTVCILDRKCFLSAVWLRLVQVLK